MVGGGIRRDDATPGISSKNVFAALETLKKKKKSSVKDRKESTKSKGSSKAQEKEPEPSQVFWIPTPLNKSWADVDDDDDDYYKSAPVLPGWGTAEQQQKDSGAHAEEESESDDDGLDDGLDDDNEDEAEQEAEGPLPADLIVKEPSPVAAVAPTKDPERQLSKKEQKKKELDELEALIAQFAAPNEDDKGSAAENNAADTEERNRDEEIKEGDNENAAAPPAVESKTSKKKKVKKEKSSKDVRDSDANTNGSDGVEVPETAVEEPAAAAAGVDIKERLKKVASMKKKKSGKEMDTASKIASTEAATRSAKLAAAKKKEKNHYNQQPVR